MRKIIQDLIDAINARTPREGIGISIKEYPDGAVIAQSGGALTGTVGGAAKKKGAGTSGTPVDFYGAFNGAPAIFHLLQSSDPTPL